MATATKTDKHKLAVMKRFGGNVVRIRESRELTKKAVAQRAGLSYRTLCHIENGQFCATIHTASLIAKALGCEVADLLAAK